jgi:hypothetical protein
MILAMFIIGCSSKHNDKSTIDLREYLPMGIPGTAYVSQFNFDNTNNKAETKVIVARTKDQMEECVTLRVSLTDNGKQESSHKDVLCATKNKLYRNTKNKSPIISLTEKVWYSSKIFSPTPPPHSEMPCKIYNKSTIKVEEKTYEAITVECKARNSTFLISYAKTLGRVKIEQKVKDFGVIGNVSLKKIIRAEDK